MSDVTLNRYLSSGTAAERLAFTPNPPTPASGPDPLYVWQETDTGNTYVWTPGAATWTPVNGEPALPPAAGSTFNTYVVDGGQVTWESGLTFRVSAATYRIDGVVYTSTEQTITLDAADGTHPRLDVIALDTGGDVQKITGTAAAAASEPTTDPAAYVKLALVSVPAGATEPDGATTLTLYAENAGDPTEWVWSASGGSIVVSSTTNPHTGATTIEGTAVVAGVYARGTKGSGAIDPNDYDHLMCFLRSKAAWTSGRGLLVSFRASGVLVGAGVQIRRTGTFGFDSTVTAAYQQVAIPISAFAIPAGTTVNQVQFEDFGGSIGFYLDNISLQTGASTPAAVGITEAQADARYAPLVHATRHASGGADALKLDDLAAPDDNTDLNASTSAHGLLKKLDNDSTHFLNGQGNWAAPSSTPSAHATSHQSGGGDAIKLDDLAAPDDNTDLNASTSAHGLLPKLSNVATQYMNGTGGWSVPAGATRIGSVGITIDGGGSAITTGTKGFLEVPFAGTITAVRMFADQSGSAVVDVWKDTYANYPPTVADTITASAKPTISSTVKSQDTTLTGWTTAVSAGDILGFNVDSASTITRLTVQLTIQAT
jgi:hypothetical protein